MTSWIMITGATGGLGKAFAVECASRGWNVFLTDLRDGSLETLANGLRRTYGVNVEQHACDLADPPHGRSCSPRCSRSGNASGG